MTSIKKENDAITDNELGKVTGGVDYEASNHKISIGITPEDSCDSFVCKICGDTTVHQLGLGICARCGLLVACSNCLHSSNRGDYRL